MALGILELKYNPLFFICAVQDELGYMASNALFSEIAIFNLLSVDDTHVNVCVFLHVFSLEVCSFEY